jgi:D-alanine-D-alanine ligase
MTGANVIISLPEEKYIVRDILIDKEGVWHIRGASRKPEKVLKGLDVVFIALHGEYGEDGRLQNLLDTFGMPYTGSESFPSALAMNKAATKRVATENGIKTPAYFLVRRSESPSELRENLFQAFRSLPMPVVVKPVILGSSVGVTLAGSFEALESAVRKSLSFAEAVMIEEFISGKEATCGVIDGFRKMDTYSLIPVEIRPPAHKDLFDYESKYTGITEEICPGNFSSKENFEIQRLSVLIHKALGLRHYSRADFIIHPKRGIYFLETNTLPGLTDESLLPKALRSVGSNMPEFLDHVIGLALGHSHV